MQYNYSDSQLFTSNGQGFESVYFLVVIIILLLQLRTRRVKLFGLVFMPLFMLIFTLPVVAADLPSSLTGIAIVGLGFVIGLGIGVVIGSMMEVKVDEKDGTMVLKGSILAVLIWAAIIGLKIYGKDLLSGTGIMDIGVLTSMFLMMAVGSMIARRGFIYWRYRQMKKGQAVSPIVK